MYVHEMDWNSFCKKRKLSQPILYSYKLESYYIYSLIGIIHCNPHLLHKHLYIQNKHITIKIHVLVRRHKLSSSLMFSPDLRFLPII